MSLSVKLLENLTLDRDLSVGREPLNRGRLRYCLSIFSKNMSGIILMNLLFLIFAAPVIAILVGVLPALEKGLASGAYFAGELGIGFPGVNNDHQNVTIAIYELRMIVYACVIPGFALAGVGFAGLMRCCRNYLWGVKVKLRKQFFRGIKENWLKYMCAFLVIGVAFGGVTISIFNYLRMSVTGTAPWWTWLTMVVSCLFALLLVYYMLIYLPHLSMFKMKHKDTIKNTLILDLVLLLPATLCILILGLPFLLMISSTTAMIFGLFFLFFGFGLYTLAIASFGMFAADNFILALYDQRLESIEREKKRAYNNDRRAKTKKQANKKNHR